MTIIRVAIGALLAGVLLTSCGEDRLPVADPFGKGTWRLVAAVVDGAPLGLVDTHPVTLRSAGDSVDGTSACNHYGGRLRLDGGRATIDEIFMTEMACLDEDVMDLEAAYLGALSRVEAVSLEGDDLVLAGEGVTLRFDAVPPEPDASLYGTPWTLETLIEGETASTPAAAASIRFEGDGTVAGTNGCNSFGGRYDPDTGFSDVVQTLIGCFGPIADQEALFMDVLAAGPTLTITGPRLTVMAPDGRGMMFSVPS